MSTLVRSFSKINLGLSVGPPRSDGFHGLTTIYQTLALHDRITVSAHPAATTSIRLNADHPGVPRSETGDAERNTAWKIVAGALQRLNVSAAVHIHIEKRLPVQGGMGAGSANAAAALLGLERELGRALPWAERLALAADVGSDVPLFLLGGTVLGLGRGEEVHALPDSAPLACVMAIPDVGVSTGLAFRELDKRVWTADDDRQQLTFQQAARRLEELSRTHSADGGIVGVESGPTGIAFMDRPELASGDLSKDEALATKGDVSGDLAENPGLPCNLLDGMVNPLLALVRTGMENDFEEVAFSQHPFLRSTKRDLLGAGSLGSGVSEEAGSSAIYAGLSGSGSALFGLYRSKADAEAAQHRVQQSGMRAILTETLPRRAYWRTMFAE